MELVFENSFKDVFNNYVKKDKNFKIQAKELMNDIYVLHPGLDKIQFNNKVDWNYEHHTSANTYQLYLHTLNFTKNLIFEYLEEDDDRSILKAKNIIENWIQRNSIDMNDGKYVWYDHTVSNRLINLLFFQLNVPENHKIDHNIFSETIVKHLDYLIDDDNYAHNNHGIMMDRALILSSFLIGNEDAKNKYINIAKRRIENAILRDYSHMSTHLENSPDYHVMVTSWLTVIDELLKKLNKPLKKKYQETLKNAVKFNGIISNYSREFPMLGDTSMGKSKVQKIEEDFLDIEAGIVVFNDKAKKSTLVFNCGFQNLTHKHRDDLSFVFSINKHEVFMDSGKYNYLVTDPIRKHMISPKAHTTIYVQDKSYSLLPSNNLVITSFLVNEDYKYAAAVNNLYEDIEIKRHIIIIDGETLIVYDDVKSLNPNVYIQNYILNEDIESVKINNKYFELKSTEFDYKLQEHTEKGIGNIYYGKKNNAIISRKFNEITEVNRIELKKKTNSTNFITSFSPKNVKIDDVEVLNNELTLIVNDKKYSISLCVK